MGATDLEQEAARVDAVAAAGRGLLDHGDRGAGVVGGDRRRRPGGAEADDEDVHRVGEAHVGRAGHDPQWVTTVPVVRRGAHHRVETEDLLALLEHLDRVPEQRAGLKPDGRGGAGPAGVERVQAGGLEPGGLGFERRRDASRRGRCRRRRATSVWRNPSAERRAPGSARPGSDPSFRRRRSGRSTAGRTAVGHLVEDHVLHAEERAGAEVGDKLLDPRAEVVDDVTDVMEGWESRHAKTVHVLTFCMQYWLRDGDRLRSRRPLGGRPGRR